MESAIKIIGSFDPKGKINSSRFHGNIELSSEDEKLERKICKEGKLAIYKITSCLSIGSGGSLRFAGCKMHNAHEVVDKIMKQELKIKDGTITALCFCLNGGVSVSLFSTMDDFKAEMKKRKIDPQIKDMGIMLKYLSDEDEK